MEEIPDPFCTSNFESPMCKIHNLPGLVITDTENAHYKSVSCINCLTKN